MINLFKYWLVLGILSLLYFFYVNNNYLLAYQKYFDNFGQNNLIRFVCGLSMGGRNNTLNFKSMYPNKKDSCFFANEIKKTIVEFINGENELIYKSNFIDNFLKISKYHNECYFPQNNEEINLYFLLGDTLLQIAYKEERAAKLLIDLYLVNRNNVELSEYYGSKIIPKLATKNIIFFIKVMKTKTEREANKCIGKLKYIKDSTEIKLIKEEIDKIDNQSYLRIINKIKDVLPPPS